MINRIRAEVRLHVVTHRDWFAGRCRLVATRSFPWAGFEYRLPQWESAGNRDPELVS